ncbi:MAG: precorrin-2 C(20)-methyltransferase [Thermoplasmatales archaeon]
MTELNVVGLGPGSVDHVTLKALQVLRESEIIYVPISGGENKIARRIVEELMHRYTFIEHSEIIELEFPMTRNREYNKIHWEKSIEDIFNSFLNHSYISYAVLGSPIFFSTFNHISSDLRKKGVNIRYIPGMNSVDACAALASIQIGHGNDAILTTTYSRIFNFEKIGEYDTIILLKVPEGSSAISKIRERFPDFKSVTYSRRCTMVNQQITAEPGDDEGDYFSMIIMRREN